MKYTRTDQIIMVNVEEGVVTSAQFLFVLFYELNPYLSTVAGRED